MDEFEIRIVVGKNGAYWTAYLSDSPFEKPMEYVDRGVGSTAIGAIENLLSIVEDDVHTAIENEGEDSNE